MQRCLRIIAFLPLLLWLQGCIFLTAEQIQSLRLYLKTSKNLPTGQLTEVYSASYPNKLQLKKNWVKVFGNLDMADDLPSKITLQIESVDGDTGSTYLRFKMTLKVAKDGTFSGIKKFPKDLRANTQQRFLVRPLDANIPSKTKVALCVEIVKKKGDASSNASCKDGGSGSGGGDVVTIRVLDNRFEPKSPVIQPGQTVRWVLEGNALDHTTTAMNDHWDSGLVFDTAGAMFEASFPASLDGQTFEYFCETHKDCCEMQGSIRVGNDAPNPGPGY